MITCSFRFSITSPKPTPRHYRRPMLRLLLFTISQLPLLHELLAPRRILTIIFSYLPHRQQSRSLLLTTSLPRRRGQRPMRVGFSQIAKITIC